MMSGYSSSAWSDTSQVNIAAAAAAAANSRSHQLYVAAAGAGDDCLLAAGPHHNCHYDTTVKQLQCRYSSPFTGLLSADMSSYSDERFPLYGSYCAYSSCSPPPRAAALAAHSRLSSDYCSDDTELTQNTDSVTNQQLSNNDSNGNNILITMYPAGLYNGLFL